VDVEVLERITRQVSGSLRPVRILPSEATIRLVLFLILVLVSIGGATCLGFGIDLWKPASPILWVVAVLGPQTATLTAAAMVPGSRKRFEPHVMLLSCTAAFAALFAVFTRDYRLDHFFSEGIVCLGLGALFAAAAGFLIWLVLRRGCVLDPPAAGISAGTLAGLAGFAFLELHCPIQKAAHLMVWHTAVIALSGLAGFRIGRFAQDLGTKRRAAEFMQ